MKKHKINAAEMLALSLTQEGYRVISKKDCRISRVDRADWLDVLAESQGHEVKQRPGGWADYYRRRVTLDVRTIGANVIQYMKASKGCDIGYRPKREDLIQGAA